MNILSQFQNQVFISYAHIDNASLSGTPSGWIDALHTRLEQRLAMLLGQKTSIWRDPKVTGHDVFNVTIELQLAESALLLSVLSPWYLNSDVCLRELSDFLNLCKQSGGIRLKDKHRVFKVIKTFVPRDQHPEELKGLLGYEFFEHDLRSGRPYEFEYEVLGTKDQRYFNKLEDLAQDIAAFLTISSGETVPDQQATPEERASVYLAETTTELYEARDRIKRELQQYGYIVLPDKPLPLDASTLRAEVEAYLRRSRLSVHFIGTQYGVIPEGEQEYSVVHIQEKLAAERSCDANFFRLLWLPPGLEPKDVRQKTLIADLQANPCSHSGSELLQVKLEDLKTIIHDKLTRSIREQRRTLSKSIQSSIYLICDRQDLNAAKPVQHYLLDQGYEAILPLVDGGLEDILEDRKQNLLSCDAVLIFYANASEAWLKAQLRELIKMPGLERQTPLLAKTFYLAAPQTPAKELFKCNVAPVVRNYGEFDPGKLLPFLVQIAQAERTGR
jgi:hypothetical protein